MTFVERRNAHLEVLSKTLRVPDDGGNVSPAHWAEATFLALGDMLHEVLGGKPLGPVKDDAEKPAVKVSK